MMLDFIRQVFGSPGGKKLLAKKIVSLIPEHAVYVEPFVGGGAVYFTKEPSEREVISDKDSDIIFAYKFIKNLTPEKLARLKRLDWHITKEKFYRIAKTTPSDDVQKFYKFITLKMASYGRKGYEAGFGGETTIRIVDRLEEVQKRLKNTAVLCDDYKNVIKKYDSPNTFFYLDPPYPETTQSQEWKNKGLAWSLENFKELLEYLKNIKGKFLLTITHKLENEIHGFQVKKVEVKRTMDKDNVWKTDYELFVTNYDTKKFEMSCLEFIRDPKNYDPKKLSNEVLADDWRIVLAWWSTKRKGGKVKHSLEDIANLAQLIYDEIVRRVKAGKMKHEFQPEKMKPHARELYEKVSKHKTVQTYAKDREVTGLYFNYPHGTMIYQGTKKLIVKSKLYNITNKSFYLMEDLWCFGTIKITGVKEIGLEEFQKLYDQHRVTEAERKLWWPDRKTFYAYTFKWLNKFDRPVFVEAPQAQTFVRKTTLKFNVTEHIERIHILGSRALNPVDDPKIKLHSSIAIVVCGKYIQFDAGNPQKDTKVKPVALFITHAHPDHIGHIEDFTDIPVYAIEDVWNHVDPKKFANAIPLRMNEPITIAGMIIEPFKVEHSKKVETCGYLIHDNQRKISYVPDVIRLTPEAKKCMKDNDIWFIDGSSYTRDIVNEDYGHASIKTVMEWAKELKPKAIYFLHIGKDTVAHKQEALEYAKKIVPQSHICQDGMMVADKMEFSKYAEIEEFKDMCIIKDFISVAGSYIDSEGKKYHDIDLIIRMNPPNDFIKRALYARFEKMLPPELFEKLHLVFDTEGPHSSFIPLYDLCLQRIRDSTRVEMSATIKIMRPYLPAKPKSPAFYDIEKLMEALDW